MLGVSIFMGKYINRRGFVISLTTRSVDVALTDSIVSVDRTQVRPLGIFNSFEELLNYQPQTKEN